MDKRPIGIFDSGVGGLTVLNSVRKYLPNEDLIYLGDTARVPYGSKSKETIERYSLECSTFLKNHNVKLIIVACNTASSLAYESLKTHFDLPIIDVVTPSVKHAYTISNSKRIGIIGTKATIKSNSYVLALHKLDKKIKTYTKACPLFVPLVEEDFQDKKPSIDIAKIYLKHFIKTKIDTLILGCTHYPLLKNTIKKVLGNKIKLIESGEATSLEALKILKYKDIENSPNERKGKIKFYITDDPNGFKKIAKKFLSLKVIDANLIDLS